MLDLNAAPGLIFVVGALLPLLGCLLIAVASLWHGVLRPIQGNSKVLAYLYTLLGGDQPGYVSGFIATLLTAVALMFGVIGMASFLDTTTQHEENEKQHTPLKDPEKERQLGVLARIAATQRDLGVAPEVNQPALRQQLRDLLAERDAGREAFQRQWNRRDAWLQVLPVSTPDSDRGTAFYLGFKIDALAGLMFILVALVSLLVHIYSLAYMEEERHEEIEDPTVPQEFGVFKRRGRYSRYFLFLGLFTFAMLHLVIADNLLQVFLSWELVGLGSYFLIGFWYERDAAANAATKAFLLNRVGDAGFLIGMAILWTTLGTLSFDEMARRVRAPLEDSTGLVTQGGQFVYANPLDDNPHKVRIAEAGATGGLIVLFPQGKSDSLTVPVSGSDVAIDPVPTKGTLGTMSTWLLAVAGLCLFLGCMGKSAQGPLYTWLPDAMEGPTPISALIHAATMVAAGVYLIARIYPLLSPEVLLVIAYIGLFGLIVGAITALFLDDIKRILAFSTISQLGLMLVALGVGGWSAGLFHLITHAFFKALLFLGAGAVLQACAGEGNQRKLGGLSLKMPLTATTMLLAVLCISGLPFLSGWYSKDAILGQCFGYVLVHPWHVALFLGPLLIAGVTAYYMFRLWILVFTGLPQDKKSFLAADEPPALMAIPLMLLTLLSICAGWGWVPWDTDASYVQGRIHSDQPLSVQADFGTVPEVGEVWEGGAIKPLDGSERLVARHYSFYPMVLTLLCAGFGVWLAVRRYAPKMTEEEYIQELEKILVPARTPQPVPHRPMPRPVQRPRLIWHDDEEEEPQGTSPPATNETPPVPAPAATPTEPAPAKSPQPGFLETLLVRCFYLDAVYRMVFVVPALWLGRVLVWIDRTLLDSVGQHLAGVTVAVARVEGAADNRVVDATVRGVAGSIWNLGGILRRVQTGSLRGYLLFLLLAAVGGFLFLYTLALRISPG